MPDNPQFVEREVLARKRRHGHEPRPKAPLELWAFFLIAVLVYLDESAHSGHFVVWYLLACFLIGVWRSRKSDRLDDPAVQLILLIFAFYLLGVIHEAVWERMVGEELFPTLAAL